MSSSGYSEFTASVFPDHEERSVFDLVIYTSKLLAHDPDACELDTAEHEHGGEH